MNDLFPSLIKKVQARSGSYQQLDLVEGLDSKAIEALEGWLNLKLPNSFTEALQCYGKTVVDPDYPRMVLSIPHYGEMGLVSEMQLRAVYQLLQEANYHTTIEHACNEIGTAKKWHATWVPVAAYANYYLHTQLANYDMLILDEESPLYQQVIYWSHREGAIRVVAASYEDYLRGFYNALDSMGWDETYGFSY